MTPATKPEITLHDVGLMHDQFNEMRSKLKYMTAQFPDCDERKLVKNDDFRSRLHVDILCIMERIDDALRDIQEWSGI